MLNNEYLDRSVPPTSSIICVSEKKASYCVENAHPPIKIEVYNVDGGLIKEGRKCDKLIIVAKYTANVLVELKGSDAEAAIEQLYASYLFFKNTLSGKYFFRVCLSGRGKSVPEVRATATHGKLKKVAHDKKLHITKPSDPPEPVTNFA
jgi:hypothetical protein